MQHVGHVIEFGLAIVVRCEVPVVNQPKLVGSGIDIYTLYQAETGNQAVGVAAILAADEFDTLTVMRAEHGVDKKYVTPGAEYDLRAHLLPELIRRKARGFEKTLHIVMQEASQMVD